MIIKLLLIIYLFIGIFTKPSNKYLYCGIFAYNGPSNLSKNLWRLVIANMKILGMEMDARGGDNTGILIDGVVHHGKQSERKFQKFIENVQIMPPTESSTIIGHCRKASVGGIGLNNSHPIEIFNNRHDADFTLAGVHNGTIKNWNKLLTDYNIPQPHLINLDSEAMFEIINNEDVNNITVFEKYIGGGTFVWYRADEPNSLYLFKGASKMYTHGKVIEERPLFHYYCAVTKGVYFCSTEEALEKIAENADMIKDTQINHVIKFTNGKFQVDDTYEINRDNVVDTAYSTKHAAYNHYGHGYCDDDCNNPYFNDVVDSRVQTKVNKVINLPATSPKIETTLPKTVTSTNLVDEKSHGQNWYGKKIYRDKHLYYRNGHLVDGKMCLDIHGNDVVIEKDNIVPVDAKVYYFNKGILFLDEKKYNEYLKKIETNSAHVMSPQIISHLTMYPYYDSRTDFFYFKGKAYTGLIEPPFCDGKKYKFVVGKLTHIEYIFETHTKNVTVTNPITILDNKKDIAAHNANIKLLHGFNSLNNIVNEGIKDLDYDITSPKWDDDSLFENTAMWVLPTIIQMVNSLSDYEVNNNGIMVRKNKTLIS